MARPALTAIADTSHMEPLLVTFAGGSSGLWRVERIEAVRGAAAFPSRTACCDRRGRRKDPGGLRLDPARGNKQRTLRRRRRARRAGRPPAVPRAAGGDARCAHPHLEIGTLVGPDAGGATGDLCGAVEPHSDWARVPSGRREAPPPWAGPR